MSNSKPFELSEISSNVICHLIQLSSIVISSHMSLLLEVVINLKSLDFHILIIVLFRLKSIK